MNKLSRWFRTVVAACIAIAGLAGIAAAGAVPASAASSQTLALRVLLIGGVSGDPTTAAWEASLSGEGVPYTEVTASGAYFSETVALPALTSGTNGNFDGVVIADAPAAFAAGQLTALDTYESTYGVRQIDGYGFPSPSLGMTDASSGTLDGTTAQLTPAGLAALPALKGPIPFATGTPADPATFGYPATVNAGAPFTPWIENTAGQVLAGVYQHPATDPQANVAELELNFDYNATMIQWLLLGPGLIDWVTGGAHVGLYRNYFGEDIDDLFIADNSWDSALQCTPSATDPVDYNCPAADQGVPQTADPDVQMSDADVAYVDAWEKSTGITLELAFNAIGACTAPPSGPESTASCTGSVTDPGGTYSDPGQATDPDYPEDAAFVNALLADQADFDWITHTWSHMYLGCSTFQPLPINPISLGGTGSLAAGTYSYEVTAATAYGESEPSVPQSIAVGANGSVILSWADATNGGGPTLWQEEANHTGGSGFWGYNVYREDPNASTYGFIGSVAEDATGTTTTYNFTDTGAAASGGGTTVNSDTGGAILGSGPTSTATSPTATNPGIECAGTNGQDWLPATSTQADSSISQEIGLDQAFAAANNLTHYNPATLVTGEHSGLENPNLPLSFQDTGVTVTATDTSRQPTQYALPYPNGSDSALTAPRYPSNIYYNAANWPDEINEYNTLYVEPSVSIGTYDGPESNNEPVAENGRCEDTAVTTCLTTPATETSILASESSIMLSHVLANDPRVGYAHQTNLIGDLVNGQQEGYTILSLISDMQSQYDSWYNTTTTPLDQIIDASSSQLLSEQSASASAQNQVTATQTGDTVTLSNTGTTSVTVPVTVPAGSAVNGATFGQPYGGNLSEWLTLAGGASQTVTVPGAAPAFTSAAAASFGLNAAGTFAVTTSGTPSATVTENGTLPAGVTFTPNTTGGATFAGTPMVSGSFPITLAANNTAGTATQSFVLSVTEAPTITSAASAPSIVGVAGSFTVTTTGTPFPAITESGPLPSGVSFVDNHDGTATLAGTPAAGTGGPYPITITATNSLGTASRSFTLTNASAPAITSANTATFSTGVAGSYTVTTTGYPAPGLTESGTLPTGLSFVDNADGTGTLSGTPAIGSAGSYSVSISATNASKSTATLGLTITVNAAGAPTITSGATADFTLSSGGAVAITATGSPTPTITETGALPAGLAFVDNGNGTALLSGTPTATGTTQFTVTAGNGVSPDATQTYTVVVGQAPSITSTSSAAFAAGVAGTFGVTTSGYPAPSLGANPLPAGVGFTDNGDGTATLSATASAATGMYGLTITATNGTASTTQSFTLTIGQASQAISFTGPSTGSVGTAAMLTATGGASGNPVVFTIDSTSGAGVCNVSGTNGTTLNYTASGTCVVDATQAGNANYSAAPTANWSVTVYQVPTFTGATSFTAPAGASSSATVNTTGSPTSAIAVDPSPLPAGVSLEDNQNNSATLAWTSSAAPGVYTFTLSATNTYGSTTQQFTLTLTAAPTISSAASTGFMVNQPASFKVTTTGTPTAALSESGAPTGVSFVDNHDGTATLSGTVSSASVGTFTIAITANNGISPNATQSFTLTVISGNVVITSLASTTFKAGTAGSFTVTASGTTKPTLSESGKLPAGLTFNATTGVLSGTPAATASGIYPITFTAKNTTGTTSQAFTLTVDLVPSITSATALTETAGTAFGFTVATTGYPTPTLSTGSLPGGVSFSDNGNGTGLLSGTATVAVGTYNVAVTATNAGGSTAKTITLTVKAAGTTEVVPTITSPTSASATAGTAFTFIVTTAAPKTGYTTNVTHSGTLPAGVSFTNNGNGTATLKGTPTAASGGTYPITFTAKNTAGTTTQSFVLIVGAKPAITSAASTNVAVGASLGFTVKTTGSPLAALSETGALPAGVSFTNNANGTASLSGAPQAGKGGVYAITISATNTFGTVTQSFSLTVRQSPVITSASSAPATVGKTFSFTFTATGYPLPTITHSVTVKGLTFTTGTGTATLKGTPTTAGTYILTITATNNNGTATQSFTLTVSAS